MVQYNIQGFKPVTYMTNKVGVKMDLSQALDKMIKNLSDGVRGIPDSGFIRGFSENLPKGEKPAFFGKDLALFVERDESRDGRAYLGVSVLHPTMATSATSYLMNGDRNRILEYISQEGFKTEVLDTVNDLAESLKNVR